MAAALAVASLLGGCVQWFLTPQAPATSTPTLEDVPEELARFYHQQLRWTGCGGGMQCTEATVPLDWDDPTGDTIRIALIRQPATGAHTRGSLLVNPGGPGGSGVNFIRDSIDFATSERLQADFDVVGFDPRGVGRSTPVVCADDPSELDEFFYGIVPGELGSDAWLAETARVNRAFGEACLAHTGDLLAHVDTESAVRDLDVLRAALGDEKLDYLGYSYGTYLGARYAELFPERAGRLALDGALDPSTSEFDVTLTQARGFESALTAYLDDCGARKSCRLSGSVDESRSRIAALMHELDARPRPGADGRMLGASTMFSAIILPLYNADSWGYLDELLAETLTGGTELAFLLADAYNDRTPDGRYSTNSTEAFLAINCLDYPTLVDVDVLRAEAAQLAEAAPVFGPWMSYGTLCAEWPFASENERRQISAPGSPDILVVGTTNDPATPYEWAVVLTAQLARGHLVTFHGEGHTAYNGDSSCVTSTVDEFLLRGVVPDADPQCHAD